MMKKLTLLIVCIFGTVLLLNGCGGKNVIIKNNTNKLKAVGLSCSLFSTDNDDKFPSDLNALKNSKFAEDKTVFTWTHPEAKNEIPFILCPGLTEASDIDSILAASPEAFERKREVLYVYGAVKRISESAFQEQAKKQSWKLP